MEERDVRGVYSHPPATGGIRLGGVVAADVEDAIRIDDLRESKSPTTMATPPTWMTSSWIGRTSPRRLSAR